MSSNAELHTLKQRTDNYAYVLRCRETGLCAVIDASEPDSVLELLARIDGRLSLILNTHHHPDHTAANPELVARTGAPVLAAPWSGHAGSGPDITLKDGDPIILGRLRGTVLATPGHTLSDLCFWFEADRLLFTGDTLFSMGCGRLFEGTARQMWASLTRLRALPADTLVLCGHDYTLGNIAFARSLDPHNAALLEWEATVRARKAVGALPPHPTLGLEARANPFLRADDPDIQKSLDMPGADPSDVFAEIRRRKDHFTA
ncbi:hydroxyacylglutathione hydrolase [Phaeovibrio sulfidiphilus]|uniref:Hydroxyacylglutathione hydrolase n=1 Tax=Phaeovibrio sulfidiphilus TaxID=1220600 RepID=A0A8J6YWW9_9PROT|nr:hydroxyacylglutathione hydrolase [Phaeovibrio sulfidiphilus]MBE1236188.1 hydroxyacylglutathione hydrolase [Phaeovibrio sulfidiphilus]